MSSNAALLIQQADGSLQEFPLLAEQTVLGRASECDIVLPGRLISRQHACISRTDRVYVLDDLSSHNGTFVNGRMLAGPHILRDGDHIELGGMGKLMFVDGDATSTRPQPSADGVWLDVRAQDVWVDGQRLSPPLSAAQFSLLQTLVTRIDRVCLRDEIVAAVWPDAVDGVSDEAIDALIKRLRARLSEVRNGARYLKNVRGRGLMLCSPSNQSHR